MSKQNYTDKILKDVNHIKNFTDEFCCVKLIDPKGGWPLNYGVILKDDKCKIYLRDREYGQVTKDFIEYNSIPQMVQCGWAVD